MLKIKIIERKRLTSRLYPITIEFGKMKNQNFFVKILSDAKIEAVEEEKNLIREAKRI